MAQIPHMTVYTACIEITKRYAGWSSAIAEDKNDRVQAELCKRCPWTSPSVCPGGPGCHPATTETVPSGIGRKELVRAYIDWFQSCIS